MTLQQNIQQALLNLMSSKLRSFLAVLGILVGTGSVVALVSSGQLATKKALDQFKALGTDLMSVSIYSKGGGSKDAGKEQFEVSHVKKMYRVIDEINSIVPYTTVYSPVTFEGKRISANTIGVTSNLQDTIKISLAKGRFISFLDKYEYFCVIGDKVYKQIKSETNYDPIGQQIKIGAFYYTIVGIANKWAENSFFQSDVNGSIMIPILSSTVLSKHASIRHLVIKLKQDINLDEVQDDIKFFISNISPNYQVYTKSASQLLESMENQSQIFTLMLGLIGGISLLVGGIGVMNVMLVSVVERKREIGIRMAVGAKRADIRTLFLIEAITLSIFGGIMGIILGIVVSYIIAVFSGWGFTIFFMPPVLGFIVSVATGIFFGFYPAYNASKLDPIQTLRYD